MMKFLILLALFLPSAALAQNQVALTSEVLVERRTTAADGAVQVSLEAPGVVTPGDHLVFVLSYRNNGAAPASDFVVSNPIPEFGRLRRHRQSRRGLFRRRRQELGRARRALGPQRRRQQPAGDAGRRDRRPMAVRAGDSGRIERTIEIPRHCKIGLEPAEQCQRGWVRALSTL